MYHLVNKGQTSVKSNNVEKKLSYIMIKGFVWLWKYFGAQTEHNIQYFRYNIVPQYCGYNIVPQYCGLNFKFYKLHFVGIVLQSWQLKKRTTKGLFRAQKNI
jgi:hypothetical protein